MSVTRYLITGGAGFIGSHLADAHLDRGHGWRRWTNCRPDGGQPRLRAVQPVSASSRAPSWTSLASTKLSRSDVVVHLAAAVGVKLIVEQPLFSLTTNIKGAIAVLEAAHRYRRKVMVASSSEIYGKNNSDTLNEQADRILGSPAVTRWAYSTSKAVDEMSPMHTTASATYRRLW